MRKAALLLVGLALVLACPREPPSAEATVRAYFATLARDPVRNLSLTSPRFQHAHGLRFVTTAEAQRRLRGERPQEIERAEPTSTDGARVAWLMTQMKPEFLRLARGLALETVSVEESQDRALVGVRVSSPGAPAFRQRFRLSRAAPADAWRIDGIEQEGLVRANLRAAAVAYPRAAIEERLRRGAGE